MSERVAARLVEMLTPAAALGIVCPVCKRVPGALCVRASYDGEPTLASHPARYDAARAELHSLLLVLLG